MGRDALARGRATAHAPAQVHMHMPCTYLAQVGTPLLALLEGEARQRGPTQADVLAAADLLVRRLLRGVALEAERAALRHGEAHAAHEEADAATVVAAEGGEGAAAERAGERGGEPEAAALRKALAAQGEALRRAEAAVAEREAAISRLEAEVRQAEIALTLALILAPTLTLALNPSPSPSPSPNPNPNPNPNLNPNQVRQAEAAAQRAQAAVAVPAHGLDRRLGPPAQREVSGPAASAASASAASAASAARLPSPSTARSSSSPPRLFDKASAPSPRGEPMLEPRGEPRGGFAPPVTAPVPGSRLDASASLAWLHSPESSPATTAAAAPAHASSLGAAAAAPVARRSPRAVEGAQPYAAKISFRDNGVAEVSLN